MIESDSAAYEVVPIGPFGISVFLWLLPRPAHWQSKPSDPIASYSVLSHPIPPGPVIVSCNENHAHTLAHLISSRLVQIPALVLNPGIGVSVPLPDSAGEDPAWTIENATFLAIMNDITPRE